MMKSDLEIKSYLAHLTNTLRDILGEDLIALYAIGSLALGDYDQSRSDIDLLGTVAGHLSNTAKDRMTERLEHNRLPCPARGVGLMLVTMETCVHPTERPEVEFAMSTGGSWTTENDYEGVYPEVPIDLAQCKQFGHVLFGPPPKDIIGSVNRKHILHALDAVLKENAEDIMVVEKDWRRHMQTGVLNACRAWRYIEEFALCSKTEGGQWVLDRRPDLALVRTALLIRQGSSAPEPDRKEIQHFIQEIRTKVLTKESTQRAPADAS